MEDKVVNISCSKLISLFWDNRIKFVKYGFIGAVIGLIIAFSIPKSYKANVLLAPEEVSSGISSNLSSLASMVGMSMKFGNTGDAIYPEIYPELFKSNKFMVDILNTEITTKDSTLTTTYGIYLHKYKKYAWWSLPFVKLIGLISNIGVDTKAPVADNIDPYRLTRIQWGLVQVAGKNITCSVDKKTSVITIDVKAQDPVVAATMAEATKSLLQKYITDYRTNKARHDLEFIKKIYQEAKNDYTEARIAYANYSDANRGIKLESYKMKLEELENEMQLKFQIYSEVSEQLQMAYAKVQEKTPAFTEVQSASIPARHNNMSKLLMLILYSILGGLVCAAKLMWSNRQKFIQ